MTAVGGGVSEGQETREESGGVVWNFSLLVTAVISEQSRDYK
jgi:hypothetical protein